MPEPQEKCIKPSLGPIETDEPKINLKAGEYNKMFAKVGKVAPDFEANAFHEGAFKNIKLSDFRGKWVVLCFYPGDFTFV